MNIDNVIIRPNTIRRGGELYAARPFADESARRLEFMTWVKARAQKPTVMEVSMADDCPHYLLDVLIEPDGSSLHFFLYGKDSNTQPLHSFSISESDLAHTEEWIAYTRRRFGIGTDLESMMTGFNQVSLNPGTNERIAVALTEILAKNNMHLTGGIKPDALLPVIDMLAVIRANPGFGEARINASLSPAAA